MTDNSTHPKAPPSEEKMPSPPRRSSSPYSTLTAASAVVETSAGRDKALKVVQYSARFYIYLAKQAFGEGIGKREDLMRLAIATGSLSLARKCMILFSPLPPLILLLRTRMILMSNDYWTAVVNLLNGIADDIVCLSKLGLLSKHLGTRANDWANRFWLAKSLNQLFKLEREAAYEGRQYRDKNRWKYRKLGCDIVFASYDVFKLTHQKELVQCVTGLLAGLIR